VAKKKRKPKDPSLVRLGENLRKAREDRGWSQEELASKAGVRHDRGKDTTMLKLDLT